MEAKTQRGSWMAPIFLVTKSSMSGTFELFQSQLLQTGKQCEAVWWLALGNMLFCRKFENCAIFPPFLGIF